MSKLSDLPNVGKVLEGLLLESGVASPERLREMGAEEAFLRVRGVDPTACIRMLYGLEGAVQGVRDTDLPENRKQALKQFHRSLRQSP